MLIIGSYYLWGIVTKNDVVERKRLHEEAPIIEIYEILMILHVLVDPASMLSP